MISKKEIILDPRKSPKNPPQLEMKSSRVILGIFSYSKHKMVDIELLNNCQAQPKPQLSWAEWLYFQLIQPPPPPPGKVYFSAGANSVSRVDSLSG